MELLQVKEYHERIAGPAMKLAVLCWKEDSKFCCCPTELMFYFYGQDRHGIPTERKQRGWIAYDGKRVVYGRNRAKAVKLFKRRVK